MKTSLLKRYFDGNYFISAAFILKEEWDPGDLVHVVSMTAVLLDAPKMGGTLDQVKGWISSGWAKVENRDGKPVLLPGMTHSGKSVKELGRIPKDIHDAVAEALKRNIKLDQMIADAKAAEEAENDQEAKEGGKL